MYVSDLSTLILESSDRPDIKTLPIGYYPTLADESLDKILLDQSPSQVEFMITPAKWAKDLDIGAIAESSQVVCPHIQHKIHYLTIRSITSESQRRTSTPGRRRVYSPSQWA
jgi:hypothetical protein